VILVKFVLRKKKVEKQLKPKNSWNMGKDINNGGDIEMEDFDDLDDIDGGGK